MENLLAAYSTLSEEQNFGAQGSPPFQSLNDQITQFPNPLHAPEIVFLLRLFVVGIAGYWQRHAERIRLRAHWKRLRGLRQIRIHHSPLGRRDWFDQRSRRSRGLVRVANQFQQMVILDMLD